METIYHLQTNEVMMHQLILLMIDIVIDIIHPSQTNYFMLMIVILKGQLDPCLGRKPEGVQSTDRTFISIIQS